jgi:hypothetical protein
MLEAEAAYPEASKAYARCGAGDALRLTHAAP